MRQAVLIYNPTSGRQTARRALPAVLEVLRRGGFSVEPAATRGPGDATRLARQAADSGVEVVFAMGGDGTLREAARGLLGSGSALGILPTGTTNVMARALGLPGHALAAAGVLPGCARRAIDVGLAGAEPFLMQASGGLDAAVMALQDSGAKKRFGKAAVAWTGLRQWWSYGYPRIEVRFAGASVRVSHFAACNIPFYAGPFRMAPDASLGSGRLDLVLFRGSGRAVTLGFARDLGLGRHLKRRDVELHRVEALEIVGPPDFPIQIDGDLLPANAPLVISLADERLWVLAPEAQSLPLRRHAYARADSRPAPPASRNRHDGRTGGECVDGHDLRPPANRCGTG